MDLRVRVRGVASVGRCAFRICGTIGRLVTASRFVGAVSTVAIKTADGSWRHPPRLSLS
jgi:hypothetical protein